MRNVLLIGDSIRMGYDNAVKKSLEGKANVHFPKDNCKFAAYVLRFLHDWAPKLEDGQIDVVHWNVGLWDNLRLFGEDVLTPIEIYAYYIERICIRIKKLFPEAKVIFATSTAVQTEKMNKDFMRYNEDIERYNNVACEIVKKHGFQINDLYALSLTLPPEAHSDPVHYYTTIGTETFTNRVLSYIAPALGLDTVPEYKEELYTDKPIGI